jgi:hypothetical protein
VSIRAEKAKRQERPVLLQHELDALVVDEAAVLDRPYSGPYGLFDPLGRVGVGHDVLPEPPGLLHRHVQLLHTSAPPQQ